MNIKLYDDLKNEFSEKSIKASEDLISLASSRCEREFDYDYFPTDGGVMLRYVLMVLPDIKGKRILDLGCGNLEKNEESGYDNLRCSFHDDLRFAPTLCRALYTLGADVVGVDLGSLEGEPYEHYRKNLLSSNSLDMLGDFSFDLVHSFGVYTSPYLRKLTRRGDEESFAMVSHTLRPQLERILKPEGILLVDHWPGLEEK